MAERARWSLATRDGSRADVAEARVPALSQQSPLRLMLGVKPRVFRAVMQSSLAAYLGRDMNPHFLAFVVAGAVLGTAALAWRPDRAADHEGRDH